MRTLISLFARNKILVNFTMVYIMLIGIISTFDIRKELRPPTEFDMVSVNTHYSGAAPDEVEKLVTIPLEEKISGVDGVKEMYSISLEGWSYIRVELDTAVAPRFEIVQEIFRAVDNVRDLPDDADDPIAREIKSQIFPVYGIALHGEVSDHELRKWADRLEDRMKQISGVNSAEVRGVTDPTIDVVVDPKKLERYSVSVSEIMQTLREWNRSAPAGYVTVDGREYLVRVDENFNETEKVSNVIIRTNDMGEGVKVRDVATVNWGFKTDRSLSRYNGKKNLQVVISKEEFADTIKVVKKIEVELEKFKKTLPKEISAVSFRNDAPKIETKLKSVQDNAVMGFVLVLVTLLLFLNFRIAFVTALGLPVSFFGSVWILGLMGQTLNSMSIIGIILVVGMLVDNSIIVAENIYYRYERGQDRVNAAIDGTSEIIMPVLGSVLTTIIAFLPLAFLSGLTGKFMACIPVVVITCLLFSLFECIFILPNHAASLMTHEKKNNSKINELINKVVLKYYRYIINFAVRKRWIVAPFVLVTLVSLSIYYVVTFKMTMFPTQGITKFSFNIEGPSNTAIEISDELMKKVEAVVYPHVGKEIESFESVVGGFKGRKLSAGTTNRGGVTVFLYDEESRQVNVKDFTEQLRKEIQPVIPSDWVLSFEVGRHGPPAEKPVEVRVLGDDYKVMRQASLDIQRYLKQNPDVTDIDDDTAKDAYEFLLRIDQEKAKIRGLTPAAIQTAAMSAFEGIAATKVRKLDDEYDIFVIFPKKVRDDIESMRNLKLKTSYSTYVTLGSIASLEKVPSLGVISRQNERRTVTVFGSLSNKKASAYLINKDLQKYINDQLEDKYPELSFEMGGEEEERRESMRELFIYFIYAIVAMYMVLSLIFDSILYPFFVILILPFGFVGAMMAMQLHGEILTFPSMIAMVGLAGIVVNDAIVLVDYVKKLYAENKNIYFAVAKGGIRRIRPILLTTFTTIAGILPAAYQIGGSDANMRPMAIVIGFGLLISTCFTILFIPSFIICLYESKNFILHKIKKHYN